MFFYFYCVIISNIWGENMQDKLKYPFVYFSLEQIMSISNKIKYYPVDEQSNIIFFINKKTVGNDSNKLFIAMLAYIKLIEILASRYKGQDVIKYINECILKINECIINNIVYLKRVMPDELMKILNLNDDLNLKLLLNKIIEGYEKENDVQVFDDNRYKPVKEKESDTMNLQSEKILLKSIKRINKYGA